MARKIQKISNSNLISVDLPWGNKGLYIVDSEPGDATRYQFLMYRDGPDDFCFCPTRSTFKLPQRLNWCDLQCMTVQGAVKYADEIGVNFHTLTECFQCMKAVRDEVKDTSEAWQSDNT